MSTITTHILDTALGKPAIGVAMSLEQNSPEGWLPIAEGDTDSDGRIKDLTPEPLAPGHYRLTAEIGDYFAADLTLVVVDLPRQLIRLSCTFDSRHNWRLYAPHYRRVRIHAHQPVNGADRIEANMRIRR